MRLLTNGNQIPQIILLPVCTQMCFLNEEFKLNKLPFNKFCAMMKVIFAEDSINIKLLKGQQTDMIVYGVKQCQGRIILSRLPSSTREL